MRKRRCEGLHAKVEELNDHILPPGVKIVPFIDRSELVHYTTQTVLHNLTEGIILVVIILLLFLGNVRGAIIVALTIPFSLLFAATCLKLKGIPANLLSLGALDFGMVVDGAVVMVENIVRHLSRRRRRQPDAETEDLRGGARGAAAGVLRHRHHHHGVPAHLHAAARGRPLVQAHGLDRGVCSAGRAAVFDAGRAGARQSLLPQGHARVAQPGHDMADRAISQRRCGGPSGSRWLTVAGGVASLLLAIYLTVSGVIGSEFLPHLDEGSLWVRGTLAPSTGPSEGIRLANQARILLCSFPEVTECTSQVGRPDDGTDTTGFFNTEYFVGLKPKEQWRPGFHQNKEEVIAAMNRELEKIPGVIWNFSQPIADNMEEAVSGVKGQLATKVYGDDLRVLEDKADQIVKIMRGVKGIEDLGVFRVLGQPNLNFTVDRRQAARYQINVADVQDAIQTAVGGNALTQVLQGEARYDLVMRYLPQYRDTKEAIENIRLLSPTGERVSLAQLCKIEERDGASEIYREGNQRYIAIKYSVRGRDLGGAVEEAMQQGKRAGSTAARVSHRLGGRIREREARRSSAC